MALHKFFHKRLKLLYDMFFYALIKGERNLRQLWVNLPKEYRVFKTGIERERERECKVSSVRNFVVG